MTIKSELTLVAEYALLRKKLNAGLAKQADVDRIAAIEDELSGKYNLTWDELFDAQFGVQHYLAAFGNEYK